jgi:hypothetical protein
LFFAGEEIPPRRGSDLSKRLLPFFIRNIQVLQVDEVT